MVGVAGVEPKAVPKLKVLCHTAWLHAHIVRAIALTVVSFQLSIVGKLGAFCRSHTLARLTVGRKF